MHQRHKPATKAAESLSASQYELPQLTVKYVLHEYGTSRSACLWLGSANRFLHGPPRWLGRLQFPAPTASTGREKSRSSIPAKPISPSLVRKAYKKVRPLEKLDIEKRGWTLDVLNIVRSLRKNEFVLSESVRPTPDQLAELHPQNQPIPDKSANNSRVLRDLDLLDSSAPGPTV